MCICWIHIFQSGISENIVSSSHNEINSEVGHLLSEMVKTVSIIEEIFPEIVKKFRKDYLFQRRQKKMAHR